MNDDIIIVTAAGVGTWIRERFTPSGIVRWLAESTMDEYGHKMELLREVDDRIYDWSKDLGMYIDLMENAYEGKRLKDLASIGTSIKLTLMGITSEIAKVEKLTTISPESKKQFFEESGLSEVPLGTNIKNLFHEPTGRYQLSDEEIQEIMKSRASSEEMLLKEAGIFDFLDNWSRSWIYKKLRTKKEQERDLALKTFFRSSKMIIKTLQKVTSKLNKLRASGDIGSYFDSLKEIQKLQNDFLYGVGKKKGEKSKEGFYYVFDTYLAEFVGGKSEPSTGTDGAGDDGKGSVTTDIESKEAERAAATAKDEVSDVAAVINNPQAKPEDVVTEADEAAKAIKQQAIERAEAEAAAAAAAAEKEEREAEAERQRAANEAARDAQELAKAAPDSSSAQAAVVAVVDAVDAPSGDEKASGAAIAAAQNAAAELAADPNAGPKSQKVLDAAEALASADSKVNKARKRRQGVTRKVTGKDQPAQEQDPKIKELEAIKAPIILERNNFIKLRDAAKQKLEQFQSLSDEDRKQKLQEIETLLDILKGSEDGINLKNKEIKRIDEEIEEIISEKRKLSGKPLVRGVRPAPVATSKPTAPPGAAKQSNPAKAESGSSAEQSASVTPAPATVSTGVPASPTEGAPESIPLSSGAPSFRLTHPEPGELSSAISEKSPAIVTVPPEKTSFDFTRRKEEEGGEKGEGPSTLPSSKVSSRDFNFLIKLASAPNKYKAAEYLLKYSEQLEDINLNKSLKLLALAEGLLNE